MVTFSTFLPVAALAAAAAPASASAYALFELLIAVAEAKLEAGEAHAAPYPEAAMVREVHLVHLVGWLPGAGWTRPAAERNPVQAALA